jgi:phospholipid/cholesterol/gamma-HCH transport system substrate-binding protein
LKRRSFGVHPAWWTAILLALIVGVGVFTPIAFDRNFKSYADVLLTTDRSGLVMDPYAKIKYRGVLVGRVRSINAGSAGKSVTLSLELDPDQLKYIPANVKAQITAPTAFGSKYVELLPPDTPSSSRLTSGAVLHSGSVSDEVNTTFSNLVGVLDKIDVVKLNGALTALADGFRGKGQQIGEATTDFNQYLAQINPRSDQIREDFNAFKDFSDTYSAAAPDILRILDAASTTSTTIADNAKALDSLLLSVIGLSTSGTNLIGPNKDHLVHAINDLEPTTRLLFKYNPELTCTLLGAKVLYDQGFLDTVGGNGYSVILDAGLLFGDDPYKYPDNLPIVGQKGGPGGKPGCGSLPDASKNWPIRYIVTNSGWGTGNDIRVNPGIGFPGWANFFPATRGVPEPPSIKDILGGPAPGPIPYPDAPPFGAPQYAPDGTPLYPGLPPAPPPGQPRDPGPTPGSEPFTGPAFPGPQPTPNPLPPAP